MNQEFHSPETKPANKDQEPLEVCTVGHSTRSLDEFVRLLRVYVQVQHNPFMSACLNSSKGATA